MKTLNASGKHYHVKVEEGDTEQLRRILVNELPFVIGHFARKNKQYGENAGVLGVRGQFADIWRKIGLLKTAMWDGEPERLQFEDVTEVIWDLIGHLLLTLDMLQQTSDKKDIEDLNRLKIVQYEEVPNFWTASEGGPLKTASPEVAAQLMREAKGGPETWVFDYTPRFRNKILSSDQMHAIRLWEPSAMDPNPSRCPWHKGDGNKPENRCVGVEGHESHRDMQGKGRLDETFHINGKQEAWQA